MSAPRFEHDSRLIEWPDCAEEGAREPLAYSRGVPPAGAAIEHYRPRTITRLRRALRALWAFVADPRGPAL